MTRLRIFFHRLLGLFLRRKLERELEEEIRSHLEMQIEDNLRQGMSPEDARRAARLKFGGVEQVKEAYRDKSRLGWIESLWQDLRYGVRMLLKSPGFHDRGYPLTCDWDRGEHGALQRRQCRPMAPSTVSGRGAVGASGRFGTQRRSSGASRKRSDPLTDWRHGPAR